eukprot:6013622-Alexandrium_andersonii.AAC.1
MQPSAVLGGFVQLRVLVGALSRRPRAPTKRAKLHKDRPQLWKKLHPAALLSAAVHAALKPWGPLVGHIRAGEMTCF